MSSQPSHAARGFAVATVVLLVGLAAVYLIAPFIAPRETFTAETSWALAESAASDVDQFTSREALLTVLQNIDAGESPEALLRRTSVRLDGSLGDDAASAQRRLTVAFTDHDAARAAGLVNQLAKAFARSAFEKTAPQARMTLEAARERLRRAGDERQQAETALEEFLLAGAAHGRPENAPSIDPSATVETSVGDGVVSSRRRNPAWITLSDERAALLGEKADALARLKPAHPRVRDLEWRIEQLSEQLARTEQYEPFDASDAATDEPASPEEGDAATDVAAKAAPQGNEPSFDSAARRELERIQDRLAAARRAYDSAIADERAAWLRVEQLNTSASGLVGRAATVVEAQRPQRPYYLGLTAIAALLAGLVASRYRARADRPLRSSQQFERIRAIPVIGVLPRYSP